MEWIDLTECSPRCGRPAPELEPSEEGPRKRMRFMGEPSDWGCRLYMKKWLHETSNALMTYSPLDGMAVEVDPIKHLTEVKAALELYPDAKGDRYLVTKDMCSSCRCWLKEMVDSKIRQIWAMVPIFFGMSMDMPSEDFWRQWPA